MSQFAFNPKKVENKAKQNISSNNFFAWSSQNIYRTSYTSMRNNDQVEPINYALKGYGGFIPGERAQSKYSKSYTNVSKECFASESLGKNPYNLSSTGNNYTIHHFKDLSKQAYTSLHGKSAIISNHPCIDGPTWESQTKETYKHPKAQNRFCYRETPIHLVNTKQNTKISGFVSNIREQDGQGNRPHHVLGVPKHLISETSYRSQFCQDKPIHRNTVILNLREHKH